MLRKAIVHIGPMKTGSTSIQHWLFHQREMLEKSGVHVVQSLGRNMSRLSALVQAKTLGQQPIAGDMERLTLAQKEIESLSGSIHTIVISAEMLGQQLHRADEVATLKAILDQFCNKYQVITYLRRQDELSVSRYSTALRRGEKTAKPLSRAIDYHLMLSAWAQVFGREAITARIFERSELVEQDVVRDFAQVAGLPFEPVAVGPVTQNSSLRADAQRFLTDLAQRARTAGKEGPLADYRRMDEVNRVLDRHFLGKGVRPARAEAIAFYDAVRESNEVVRKSWFPDRATLFSEDFSGYPETEDPLPQTEQLLEIAMTVLTQLVTAPQEGGSGDRDAKARRALNERARERRRERQRGERSKRADAKSS